MPLLEIEKKFIVHKNSELQVKNKGGVFLKEISFTDIYFDTKNQDLTLKDIWLRQREGKWQLKHPPDQVYNSFSSQYIELDIDDEIVTYILKNFPTLFNKDTDNTMVAIGRHLFELARFASSRRTYTIFEFSVDFDKTDFGYEVGEIELLSDKQDEEIQQTMIEKIDKFSASIEFSTSERVKSKVETFLERFRPENYERLVAANILGRTV